MTGGEWRAVICFTTSAAAAIGFVVTYGLDGPNWLLGSCLALALGAAGIGLVTWSRVAVGDESAVDQRHRLVATDDERREVHVAIRRGTDALGRRKAIMVAAGGAATAAGAMLLVPLGSLGPRVGDSLTRSPWTSGRRLVDSEGNPIAAETIVENGLITAFPEGALSDGNGPVVVVRLPTSELTSRTVDGGAYEGVVAYSKVCTHAGCSVGLFQADQREPDTIYRLLCPCHQSLFDPLDGAEPVGGPATRPLPQLPLAVDDDGNLTATGGFPSPVGPAFWKWP